jgi:hypothetical protein
MDYSRLAARLSFFARGLSAVLGEAVNAPAEEDKEKGDEEHGRAREETT